jgi:hypothetical protein
MPGEPPDEDVAGGPVKKERVKLEREVYRLTQVIAASSSTLPSGANAEAQKADLKRAVALRADVLRRLEKLAAAVPED